MTPTPRLPFSIERPDFDTTGWKCAARGCGFTPFAFFCCFQSFSWKTRQPVIVRRRACQRHAERFAKRHGLEMPPA